MSEAAAAEIWAPPGSLGARVSADGCTFRVWAPLVDHVGLHLHADDRIIPMIAEERGYQAVTVSDVGAGARYSFRVNDRDYPDPASRYQPDGVHAPSAVVDDSFAWTDHAWQPPALHDLVIYELHTGTFTDAGTFEAIIPQLARLKDIGINAIELLPIAQFPGARNWGYDGVFPSAVQNTYGGPQGLKKLVDAAHAAGIAVILDVVYNHIGPEGNYLPVFGPYFTEKYRTPWGQALNFDDAWSDEVRAFFFDSAAQWLDVYHIDGLRFDAVHAIVDASARPFLAELTDLLRERARRNGRTFHLIAESDLSDPRIITPTDANGFGFDAQWLDDYHHALHSIVTGETQGYYSDYGELRHLAATVDCAYVYAGEYSRHRGRRHGAPARNAEPKQFVVCAQNHDQVGNRLAGDRLSTLVPFDTLKLIAAATLLAPYVPMLFMGEEYGEEAPFPYFVDHGDPQLIEAVRKGRKEEFKSFGWAQEPPDPQAESTFRSAVIDPARAMHGKHRALLALHRDLIALRKATRLIREYDSIRSYADEARRLFTVTRSGKGRSELTLILNFGQRNATVPLDGEWRLLLATDDPRYSADLAPALAEQPALPNATGVAGEFDVASQCAALLERVTGTVSR
jgi:maltooligosyltrehalose trehalohydrolase